MPVFSASFLLGERLAADAGEKHVAPGEGGRFRERLGELQPQEIVRYLLDEVPQREASSMTIHVPLDSFFEDPILCSRDPVPPG